MFVQWCHLLHVVVVHRRGGVGRVRHSHEEACLSGAGELAAGNGEDSVGKDRRGFLEVGVIREQNLF